MKMLIDRLNLRPRVKSQEITVVFHSGITTGSSQYSIVDRGAICKNTGKVVVYLVARAVFWKEYVLLHIRDTTWKAYVSNH